jgi:hypothetical protein
MAEASASSSAASSRKKGAKDKGDGKPDLIKAVRFYFDKMIVPKGRKGALDGMKVLLLDEETVSPRLGCWSSRPAARGDSCHDGSRRKES